MDPITILSCLFIDFFKSAAPRMGRLSLILKSMFLYHFYKCFIFAVSQLESYAIFWVYRSSSSIIFNFNLVHKFQAGLYKSTSIYYCCEPICRIAIHALSTVFKLINSNNTLLFACNLLRLKMRHNIQTRYIIFKRNCTILSSICV